MGIQRWQVKYIIAGCGVLAFYLGAFWAFWLYSLAFENLYYFLGLLAGTAGGLAFSSAAMWAARAAIGPAADHAKLSSIYIFSVPAALFLYFVHLSVRTLLSIEIPGAVENLLLWLAGVLAVWTDEPAD